MRRFIGDKAFYKSVLTLLIPIVIQQFISSFVSLLDNMMVSGLGKESITAAAVANQVMMVFNLAVFGGLSGISIFGAQFYGKGDMAGMRNTFRAKIFFTVVCSATAIAIYLLCGQSFISSFLRGESNGGDPEKALREGVGYLQIMLFGLLPFALTQTYAGTLRESGETVAPMKAGIAALLTNLFLNWILINGVHVGDTLVVPRLEVMGAAIATVISRFVELAIVVIHAHRHEDRYPFLAGAYKGFRIPGALAKRIIPTAMPLLINEVLWSLGMTFINNFYSSRGMNALAALQITGTVWNLFCVIMFAMGSAVSIMVGQRLGAGKMEEARDVDRKLIFLTEAIHVAIGLIMILASPVVPKLFPVDDEQVENLVRQLLVIAGLSLPLHSFAHVTYFTIRSGGRTVITFLFDAVYTWAVTVALAFVLTTYTDWDIIRIYFCVQFIDVIKLVIGLLMLRSDFWAQNVVNET